MKIKLNPLNWTTTKPKNISEFDQLQNQIKPLELDRQPLILSHTKKQVGKIKR